MTWDVIGAPFSLEHSSCSNMKPKMFSWDDVELDVEIWIDTAIEQGIVTPKRRGKKYAWICESRSIVPFLSNLYSLNQDGRMFVGGITPILQDMIDEFDVIFTCDKDLVKLHEKIHFSYAGSTLPWIHKDDYEINSKGKFCSMISSHKVMCKGHEDRRNLFERIKKEFGEPPKITYEEMMDSEDNRNPSVHIFGGITGKPFGVSDDLNTSWHNKAQALKPYMYSIVMENDRYPSYFTEKLTDCFVTGTVPIYWGAPDIGDYFNTDGMFIVNSIDEIIGLLKFLYNPQHYKSQYSSRIEHIRNNFHKVNFMESPDDMLCRKVSTMEKVTV